MAFNKKWNPQSKEGKARLGALLQVVSGLSHRTEIRERVKKHPVLRKLGYDVIYMKLEREASRGSELGKAWNKVPLKENLLNRSFPQAQVHSQLREDIQNLSPEAMIQKYRAWANLSSRQRREVREQLGLTNRVPARDYSIPQLHPTARDWWTRLPVEQWQTLSAEFLRDYRSDCRQPGNTNDDLLEKWKAHGCPNADGLKYAARSLGERKNRLQIAMEIKTHDGVDNAINSRLLELIHSNSLNTLGLNGLFQKIKDEFTKDLNATGLTLGEERFKLKVDKLLWQDGPNTPLAELKEIVKFNRSLEPFIKYHGYIPREMIESKAKEITGVTNVIDREKVKARASATIPGILRFGGKEGLKGRTDFEFPHISFRKPYAVQVTDPNRWKAMNINGANIGIPFNRDMKQNPTRQAFSLAKHLGVDVVLVQNTLDLVTTKAQGPRRALEAGFSGREITLDIMDPVYREEAARILDEIAKGNPELIYEIASEALMNLMTGWHKITWRPKYPDRPDNKETIPEFNGLVLVQFGYKEEAIIAAMAYGEALYETLVKQKTEKQEYDMASRAIKRNEKQIAAYQRQIDELTEALEEADGDDRAMIERDIAEINAYSEGLAQENASFERQAEELEASFAVRFRVSNIAPELWHLYMRKARAFMVSLFEDPELGIPNCKVISLGSTYLKLGEEIIEINIPGHLQVTSTLLSDYCEVYGPRVLRGEMADFVLICHPYALRYELTAREKDANGERHSAQVCTAPICVDGKFVRSKLSSTVAKVHPIGRTVFNEQFNPGVLVLSSVNHVIVPDHYSIESLGVHEHRAPALIKGKQKPPVAEKIIWEKFATDQHWGGQSQASVDCEHCGMKFDMGTAVFHAMSVAGYGNGDNGTKLPPIHGYTANDDPTQGHHFDAEHMPHPHQLLYPDIETHMREKFAQMQETRTAAQKYELAKWIMRFGLHQIRIRGAYFLTDQVNLVFKSLLKPNIDMFDGILRRAVQAGITVKGVSAFNDDPVVISDTRDIGLANWGTGNHFIKTTEGTLSEGPLYAAQMREMLLQQAYWKERQKIVDHLVKAPLYGREFIAWGTMKAPGGYEWACDYRNTPPGGVRWGAPLSSTARNDLRRGNYARIFEGKMIKHTCGDKHFLTMLLAAFALYFMGPAGAHTDGYGELGFPPNTSGIAFLGTPAEGPAAGPILLRPLLYDHIKRIMKDPRNFDWEAFLPNAL